MSFAVDNHCDKYFLSLQIFIFYSSSLQNFNHFHYTIILSSSCWHNWGFITLMPAFKSLCAQQCVTRYVAQFYRFVLHLCMVGDCSMSKGKVSSYLKAAQLHVHMHIHVHIYVCMKVSFSQQYRLYSLPTSEWIGAHNSTRLSVYFGHLKNPCFSWSLAGWLVGWLVGCSNALPCWLPNDFID